jgi:hypothetical protein
LGPARDRGIVMISQRPPTLNAQWPSYQEWGTQAARPSPGTPASRPGEQFRDLLLWGSSSLPGVCLRADDRHTRCGRSDSITAVNEILQLAHY